MSSVPTDDRLRELLLRWDELRQQGRDLSALELCAESPELLDELLRRRIAVVRDLEPVLDVEPTHLVSTPGPVGPDGSGSDLWLPDDLQATAVYRPRRFHSRGGLGEVLAAHQKELDRTVALKRIRPDRLHEATRRRFLREAAITARLQHPGIVPIYGLGQDKDGPFYTMPFIEDRTLQEAIDAFHGDESLRRNPGGRAVKFRGLLQQFIAACNTMAYAHDQGVIHRDLKPSNIMLGPYGETLVMDWGLAKWIGTDDTGGEAARDVTPPSAWCDDLTTAGAVLGTPQYMSPEQARGEPAGPASDIFSLGLILNAILTGKPAFGGAGLRGDDPLEAVREAAVVPPRNRNPRLPRALEAICLKALAPKPADRYGSAEALKVDVENWLADEPVTAWPEPMKTRMWRWVRKHRQAVVAWTLALLVVTPTVLVASFGFLLMKEHDARLVETRLEQAIHAYDARDYEKAKLLFDAITDLADHFDKLDPRKYPPQGQSYLGTARMIVERLQGLSDVRDLHEMKALARNKGELAGRFAEVYGNADALHRAADRLRFDLLLQLKDLPSIWRELRQALEPFYVLTSPDDWTKLDFRFGMLDRVRGGQLKTEVDELLFLWVKAVVEQLSRHKPTPEGSEGRAQEREIVDFALNACDRAVVFAESKAPWLALRARLAQLRGDDATGTRGRDGLRSDGEPSDVTSVRSALVAFEWARLNFPAGQIGRSLAWMRHAVRLRGDNYWYQFFLAYLEDLAGHPDEALAHYSIAAALQPDSPLVRFSRARLYRSTGKWDEAFDDFAVALRGLRDRPEARMIFLERGFLYQTMGDFASARAEYDSVIRGDATDEYGRAARLNRANLLADSGQFEAARADYDVLLADDLRDPVVRHSRAILELRMGRPGLADRDLSALLRLPGIDATDRVAYLAERAQARLLMGRAADAVADADGARRLHPCPTHDRLYQRALLAARQFGSLQLDRPDEVALLPLGGKRLSADLQAASDSLARQAQARSVEGYRASLNRGVILAALGQHDAAVATGTTALELSPYSTSAYLIRARIRSYGGDDSGALKDVERGLSIEFDDTELLELRGVLRAKSGDRRSAIKDFDRAIALGVQQDVHTHKASALLALGEYTGAVREWSVAIRCNPDLPEAFLGRARTYVRLRKWDLALADLEQATATWRAKSDLKIVLRIMATYAQCLKDRPDRLPRWVALARHALTILSGAG
jgi:serine/threonine protein kinase/lipoprotein NlpI